VETWVKLEGDISNRDGILGAPGSADFNFAGGVFRVWCGQGIGDRLIARKKTVPGVWTHLAVTRDAAGVFRLYWNGEVDSIDTRAVTNTFSNLDVGRTIPSDAGTDGWLSEFRVWNRARSADEIRADFDRSFENVGQASRLPPGTNAGETPAGAGGTPALLFTGTNWGKLHGGAKVVKTSDFPPLLTPAEASALAEKFARFHALAGKPGDLAHGQALFKTICQQCHSIGGQGGQVGPVLNGAGALGVEALLRNILTPNAAMEPGYRAFRVELKDGDVLDGILVSQDKDAIILRRPNLDDTRIAQKDVRRAAFTKMSLMPEGLLDPLKPEEVADLFAYLKTLK
jgi:putative heme-binding domain-containing protein